ncbi:MAG: UDP-N-acetylmuramoyl-tripeptide--D-alanyl-D-alanine ligase [Flavobacteriaceae bacterium]|nr:UDP-N-acetylmuramoyl-tripeptide--D-alanyl-D-alanine ligase [Flavobacteriaceae bacterium]
MTLEALHTQFLQHPHVCTDSRKIVPDSLFFALKGPNFNANKFAADALEQGAAIAIIDDAEYAVSDRYILVKDVLQTLQALARYHRQQNKAQVIALTGSNGKTTTKELMHAVLSKKYNTIATEGNLNNHIGVPLTLLRITADTEMAVVEMGANHLKEIEFLCSLAEPDFGYITNFGKAHLEGFGSEEGVIKAKSELYEYLLEHDKYVFLNADDPIQKEKLGTYIKKFGYSTEDHQYFTIKWLGADPFVRLEVEGTEVNTHLIGQYNYLNAAAAVLLGKYFNVPIPDIKSALEAYVPKNNRSQVVIKNGLTILLDAYNANPTSMKVALENLGQQSKKPTIAILGDMFELGEAAAREHQEVSELIDILDIDEGYLIGVNFNSVQTDHWQFETFEEFCEHLEGDPIKVGTVLIKGSRGMALERVVDLL